MSLTKQQNSKEKNTSSKRRALIKGSATAVPMILTLRSGAAFAETSISCAKRIQDSLKEQPKVLLEEGETEALMNFVRTETRGVMLTLEKGSGDQTVAVFENPALPGNWIDDRLNTRNGQASAFTEVDGSKKMEQKSTDSVYTYTKIQICQVITFIDEYGKMWNPPAYGASTDGSTFPYASTSCYASAMPIP